MKYTFDINEFFNDNTFDDYINECLHRHDFNSKILNKIKNDICILLEQYEFEFNTIELQHEISNRLESYSRNIRDYNVELIDPYNMSISIQPNNRLEILNINCTIIPTR